MGKSALKKLEGELTILKKKLEPGGTEKSSEMQPSSLLWVACVLVVAWKKKQLTRSCSTTRPTPKTCNLQFAPASRPNAYWVLNFFSKELANLYLLALVLICHDVKTNFCAIETT